jgi:5-methylcytosine-specific restriction protein A
MPALPPTFRPQGQRSRREAKVEYDARRGSARERGYTRRWDKARATYLQSHPLCVMCGKAGRITPANVVDHIIPHRGDQVLFWDTEKNWQSLCEWHHSSVKQAEEAKDRRC